MKLRLSPGLATEIEMLEVDSFEPDPQAPIWTSQKQAFVDAFLTSTRAKDGSRVLTLEGEALQYAARESGAFDLTRWPVLRAARNALGKVRA